MERSKPQENDNNYKVVYPTKNNQKQVGKLLKGLTVDLQDQVIGSILSLGKNPRPHGHIKINPPTKVLSTLAHYRIRTGDFRILYDISDEFKKVYILAVRFRNQQTYR